MIKILTTLLTLITLITTYSLCKAAGKADEDMGLK